jgi:hypothetical protein
LLKKRRSRCKWACGRCLDAIERSPKLDFDEPMPRGDNAEILALLRDLVNNYNPKENDE